MGWKAATIIVNNPKTIDFTSFLNQLGFRDIKPIADQSFDAVINPRGNKVYLGTYKNNLIICSQELCNTFFEDDGISVVEKIFMEKFPDSEICAITLNSVINEWGYAVLKNPEMIRFRAGCHETGTVFDYGEPLPQELNLLAKSQMDEKGNRTYLIDGENYTEDQVGENFAFSIASRYLDSNLDELDIFEINMIGFSYENFIAGVQVNDDNDIKPEISSYVPTHRREGYSSKSALYILLILVLILVKVYRYLR